MQCRIVKWLTVLTLVSALAGVTAACGRGTGGTSTPSASVTVSPTVTVTPSATLVPSSKEQVAAAYLAYWNAYAAALLNLDSKFAESAASGEELGRIRAEIAGLQRDGVALRVMVEHDFAVVEMSGNTAVVIDRYVDKSFNVVPTTKQPETAVVGGKTITDSFDLQRTDTGIWVVVRSRRLS